ncbi:DUF397 domain-containing protein [Streptomyces sp. TRM66268-LWL]|uniref:DUF397 domain-containing protein n=1 Tax=Streptomyces polyasparticus TaxID=2767826 RepID=A0ABR7SPL9_9ACTN|nr:DUF397 domain-containing protein [Streptomyces polyasparticus]MBC9716799.1 DUF397 domain-containing protein [Streptomyces polyasparticus]
MSITELAWFKSSYSGTEGDSCVEVALDWRKSTYSSGSGDDCIEIAPCPTAIHIRDSKDTTIPGFHVGPEAWHHFTGFAAEQA